MDIFDDDTGGRGTAPPVWLQTLAAVEAARGQAPATGDLARLPPELLVTFLSWLPARGLAAMQSTASWLAGPVRTAATDAVRRLGLLSLPERRLGEGWPCMLRRAELRLASRESSQLSVGLDTAAWISTRSGEPFFVCWRLTSRLCDPWQPQPTLPCRQALAVACGAMHVLVLLSDGSVARVEPPSELRSEPPLEGGGCTIARSRASGGF